MSAHLLKTKRPIAFSLVSPQKSQQRLSVVTVPDKKPTPKMRRQRVEEKNELTGLTNEERGVLCTQALNNVTAARCGLRQENEARCGYRGPLILGQDQRAKC